MKLKDADLEAIVLRVTKYKLPTRVVASQFKISQRRVQQIVRLSKATGGMPRHKRPGRRPYAVYPVDLKAEIIQSKLTLDLSASGISKHLRKKRGIGVDVNLVQRILLEEGMAEICPNKRVRKRPWVRYERTYPLSAVHLDWSTGTNGSSICVVLDDASRKILSGGEFDRQSAETSVKLLKEALDKYTHIKKIREAITDRGSEFHANKRDKDGNATHPFEDFCKENGITHILCGRAHPQTNGKVEKWFDLYKRKRDKFKSFDDFIHWYNCIRPHMSLDWDNLETPEQAFWRKLEPVLLGNFMELLEKEVENYEAK